MVYVSNLKLINFLINITPDDQDISSLFFVIFILFIFCFLVSMNTTPFSTETTIALRNTHFSTVHSHKLKLSKSLSESFVTLHKEDLIFRLWGRMYQPVPRDHKLAKVNIVESFVFKIVTDFIQLVIKLTKVRVKAWI